MTGTDDLPTNATSLYARLGGREPFAALVTAFYRRVVEEPALRALYPTELEGPRERLTAFLVQYFGGPAEYAALRGEPRLRFRHLEFPIDEQARDTWTRCMSAAIAELAFDDDVARELRAYFSATATFLINRGGLSLTGG